MRAGRRRMAPLAPLLTALAFVGAGCGDGESSDGSVAVETWAEDFCSAATAFATDIRAIVEAAGDPSTRNADRLRQMADDTTAASASFVVELRALETPDMEFGEGVEKASQAFADDLERRTNRLTKAVNETLGFSFLPAARVVMNDAMVGVQLAYREGVKRLDKVAANSELSSEVEDSEACAELRALADE